MKKGLVLEGGGMRGMFTVGVIDVMMEEGICFDGMIGVSAGATFGCNLKSHQPKRALRYNIRFRHDPRYMGLYSLLTSGDWVNAHFCYRTVPDKYDLFDYDRFEQDDMEFQVVCTDAVTGRPVYKRLTSLRGENMDWLRASASLPLLSRPVKVTDHLLLDGGITDSIPLKHFQEEGYGRCVVVLTQPDGFRKTPTKLMPLFHLLMKQYPHITKAMARRHEMYNDQLDYLHRQAEQGKALVIHPDDTLPIGRVQQDKKRMERVYQMGREAAMEAMPRIRKFANMEQTKHTGR
ncbi:MAG: patatin family protein [Bacteroidaceae bacterium]